MHEPGNLTVGGKVGIGTLEPGAKLEVNSGKADTAAVLGVSTPGAQDFVSLSGGSNSQSPRLVWRHGALRFGTAGSFGGQGWSEKMRITDTGNVGIGTTTPRARLEVAGDTILGGNVGIGTTEPYARLSIRGIGGTALTLESPTGDARNYALQISYVKYGDFGILQSNAHEGNPISAGTTALYIDRARNVGIGTTTPRARLEVAGDTILGGNVGIGTAEPDSILETFQAGPPGEHAVARFSVKQDSGKRFEKSLLVKVDPDNGGGYAKLLLDATGGTQGSLYLGNTSGHETALVIDQHGNVGIGIGLSPEANRKFQVHSTNANERITLSGNYGGKNQNSDSPKLTFAGQYQTAGVSIQGINVTGYGLKRMAFFTHNAQDYTTESEVMSITPAGNVGIGTTTPGSKLDVAGDVHATRFVTTSDLRLKTNIAQVSGVLEKLGGLHAVSFDWNGQYQSHGDSAGQRQLGLIAQDVEAAFPELVTTSGGEGYKAVDYGRLTAVLVEAVRELRAENATLRERTEVLEKATAER